MCSEFLSGSRLIPRSQVAHLHWNQPTGFVEDENNDRIQNTAYHEKFRGLML